MQSIRGDDISLLPERAKAILKCNAFALSRLFISLRIPFGIETLV
jgi:hypothetical protein